MEKSKIKVIDKIISGINNPLLTVNVETEDNGYYDFLVKSGDEEFVCDVSIISEKETVIVAKIPKSLKKVSLFAVHDDEEFVVVTLHNNYFIRLFNKIRKILKIIITKIKIFFYLIYKGAKFLWREHHFLVPFSMWGKYFKDFMDRLKGPNFNKFYNPMIMDEYNKWRLNTEEETRYEKLEYKPLISILVPVYNISREFLSACIDSILAQSYDNFELCLVDDASTFSETKETLADYEKKDKRIRVKYRKENGHISKTTNDALNMAKGEFVGLMDNDDVLDKDALYYVVLALNKNKKLDFIYTDEDKIDVKGRYCYPHFKPDYSPDTLLSLNYICHFTVIRKKLVDEVGGFEVGLEGAQDYDLFLKITEKTSNICHIPKVLYHWRMVEGSTSMTIDNKSYALKLGKKAIEKALKRRKIDADVLIDSVSNYYIVNYHLNKEPLVSIIIPTRDYVDILKQCLESIYEKTDYRNYEIIIANNGSEKEETFSFFKEYEEKYKNFKVVDVNIEFNYSRINNIAVNQAKGDYVLLLNNDTKVLTNKWLDIMVGYASQEHVGTVGAKLLYEDETVQHAGVILGLGGVASHAYIGAGRNDHGLYGRLRVPYNYAANTAACLMIKRSKYLEVDGLDENLKVAYNDIDFNIKLLENGYYNVFLPQVELIHYESKSRGLDTTSEKYKRFLKESEYMYKKWEDIIHNDPFYNENYSKRGWFMLDKKRRQNERKKD